MENMARDAFARADDIHNNGGNKDNHTGMDAVLGEVEVQYDEANLDHLIREST